MTQDWKCVEHDAKWEPAQLRYNAAGDTKPGFVCVHELENGNGRCEGNVFNIEDDPIGRHCCIVRAKDMKEVRRHHRIVDLQRPEVEGKRRYQVVCLCGRRSIIGSRAAAENDQKKHRLDARFDG